MRFMEYEIFDLCGMTEAVQREQRDGWLGGYVIWKKAKGAAENERARKLAREPRRRPS